ncbi:MAG: hypothetical protein ABL866_10660 [Devosia sp.]
MRLLRSALFAIVAASSLPGGPISAAPVLVAPADTGADEIAWGLIRDSADPAVFERFLAQFPNSIHDAEAREKLAALSDLGGEFEAAFSSEPAEPDDIALSVQSELKRLGCYRGTLDGDWGPGSRAALGEFGSSTGEAVGSEPTSALLSILGATTGRVCTPPTPRNPAPAPAPSPAPTSCFTFNGQTFCE